jgi:predicted MPP superfamily phosphohydrolase
LLLQVFTSEAILGFFLIVLATLSLIYGYIGWRLITPIHLGAPWTAILWIVIIFFAVLPFIPIIFRINGVENTAVDVMSWLGYLSLGFFSLVFAILVVRDVVWFVIWGGQKVVHLARSLSGGAKETAGPIDPERRRLLVNGINLGILGATAALTGYGFYQANRRPRLVEVPIVLDNLPESFDGFRIVQITDLHVGPTIKRGFVQGVVDRVGELSPDMIALTGDLVDGSVSHLGNDVAPLAELSALHGYYFVTGNHEYYSGVLSWLKEVERLGLDILINEHRIIERGDDRLILAGVTDYTGGRFIKEHNSDPRKSVEGAPDDAVKVLLAHQPKSIFAASESGFDLQISGHTHGGQYFPYHFMAALAQPYISGLHQHGGTQIYVSRGTGYWGPQIRLAAKSEITLLRLMRA